MCFLCCFFGLHDASLVARWLVQSFFVWFRAARERYQVTSSEEASGGEDKKRQQLYRCALPAWSPVSLRPLEVPHTVPVGHGLARWEDYRSSYGQKTSTSHSLYGTMITKPPKTCFVSMPTLPMILLCFYTSYVTS